MKTKADRLEALMTPTTISRDAKLHQVKNDLSDSVKESKKGEVRNDCSNSPMTRYLSDVMKIRIKKVN